MPSASVQIASKVNPGDLRSCRRANVTSFISFSAESLKRVDPRSAACRHPGSEKRRSEQKPADREVNSRINSFDFEKYSLENARKGKRNDQANRGANQEQLHPMQNYESADLVRPGAKCEANADFTNAFERRVSEKPVETDGRKRERESSENGEKKTEQPLAPPGLVHSIGHRTRIEHR